MSGRFASSAVFFSVQVPRPCKSLDLSTLTYVLRVAQQSGLLESALQNLANQQPDEAPCESENSWHPVTPGTMTDGSKRRMPSPTPSDERQMEGSALQKQPEDLWSRLDKLAVGHLLPVVTSMKMWSKTLISFGKFEAEKLSYWDLVISKDVSLAMCVGFSVTRTRSPPMS